MLNNASCTLYRWNENYQSYDRLVVNNVYWQESQQKNILKSGLVSANGTNVYFFGDIYPETATKDILVKGVCPFRFTATTQQKLSEEMKDFRKNYKFITVMTIDDYTFGNLPHIEVSGR